MRFNGVLALAFGAGLLFNVCACDKAADGSAAMNDYKTSAIAAEAKLNLKMVMAGAKAYAESEHCADAECSKAVDKVVPVATNVMIGAVPDESTIGKSYQADPAEMEKSPWKDFYASFTGKLYYSYMYTSDGKNYCFKAAASVKTACDSIYVICGNAETGEVDADITDVSDTHNCKTVEAKK